MNKVIFVAFLAFLFANLLLGLYKGKGVKTMKDYALANRAMGTGTLMITIIATMIGCKYVTGAVFAAQQKGIITAVLDPIGYAVCGLFLGRVVFPKLLRFKNCYTLGDIMGQHYGPKAQLATGLISTIVCLLVIAAQLLALQNIAAMLDIPSYIIIALVGGAVTFYTFSGGMRAVAATDILQFALVMGGFVFIVYQILGLEVIIEKDGTKETIDGIGDFIEKVRRKIFILGNESQHLSVFSHNRFWRFTIGFLQNSIIFFSPAIINRVLAARNRPQIRQAFTGVVFFYPVLRLILVFIGFGLLLTYGYEPDKLISEHNVFNVINAYLFPNANSLMVQILLMVMLLGVIMSTADSFLNALVVVVIRDIIQYKQEKKESATKAFTYVQNIALAAGISSVAFAYLFSYFDMFSTTLFFSARNILGGFIILVIAAAFKLKGNDKTFFGTIGVFLGLLVVVGTLFHTNIWIIGDADTWKNRMLFRSKMHFAVIPIILITSIAFLFIHTNVYGRLTWENPKVKSKAIRQVGGTKERWRTIFSDPLVWAKDTFARYGNEPTAVGFFLALTSVARVGVYPRFHQNYTMTFAGLNLLAVLVCTLLMLHVAWTQPFKAYFPLFYYGGLIYVLPFVHMLLFLYQPMSMILLIQLVLSIILLHLLVDWRSYCLFTLLGWGAAGIVYWFTAVVGPQNAVPSVVKTTTGNMVWTGLVSVASAIGLGFLFCSRQEQINTQRLMRTKTYAAGFGHDLLNLYQCPQSTIDYVQHAYTQGRKEMINEAKEWNDMARYMRECAAQAHAFKKLVKFDYIPQSEMKLMSMKALIKKAHGLIPSFLRDIVRIKSSRDFQVEVFPPFMNNIILNLVKNSQKHGNAKEIVLFWDAATRRLYIEDNGSGIPSHVASKIRDLYTTSSQDGTGSGIGLAFVFMVVEDIFNAQIDFTTSDKGTTFWIEFSPIKRS